MENNNVFTYPIFDITANAVNCDGRCVVANTKCKNLIRLKTKPYPQIICMKDYNKPIDTQNKPTDKK